jgi:hypothetical protein
MAIGWREALAAAAVLFLAFLLLKLRPTSGRRGALSADVRAARARAYAATTPRARAEALCEAGALAVKQGRRWTAGAGFFLRAMNADPAWPEAVANTVAALHRRRPKLLEKILWRRMAHVPWDEAHRPAVKAMAEGLRHLYAHEIRDSARAEVFKRLVKTFETSG